MDWKRMVGRALFPHPAIAVLLGISAAVLLAYSLTCLEAAEPLSIASFALSFYVLVVCCCRMPQMIRAALRFRRENACVARYTSDVRLRINISLMGALVMNAAYAMLQLALGLRYRSVWFCTMAGYYAILTLMRLLLLRHSRTYAPGERLETEWRRYRLCGVCLLLTNLALAVMIPYFVFRIRMIRHHEITVIAMAAYTFTSLTLAIVNAVRYRRYGSPIFSAAKAIALVSAVVSMLTLENAMLVAFSTQGEERLCRILLGASGVGVMLFVLGISLYMVRRAHMGLAGISGRAG
ncbi:MAG: hypothetical protein J6K32_05200 [Clostridia bacterium]|nr:hypothetical protein [Clostridia bacterium]